MSFYNRSFHFFLSQTKTKMMSFKDHETSKSPHQPCDTGLMLCTEYLGFESYDMKMSDDEVENKMTCHAEDETEMVETKRRKTSKNVVALDPKREFPPTLSSLNGHRSFYLHPVRKDGRLELTKVMVDRPEIFHVSRENGRLRLHLVDSYCDLEETVDLEDEEDNNNNGERDQVVDLSMINNEDNDAATSWRCKSCHESSLNGDVDVTYIHDQHDAREWRYKNCYKIVASHNHDENNYHRHHHHRYHHIHPYHHHNNNDNMHLWSWTYVKTRCGINVLRGGLRKKI